MRKSFRALCAAVVLAAALLGLVVAPALAGPHIFSTSFGSGGSEAGQVSLAFNSGLAVNTTTHDVYVADTGNHRVDQFSSSGTFIRAWGWGVADGLPALEECVLTCQAGLEGTGPGELTAPAFVAVDNSGGPSAGDVYVGDTATNTVAKFSASGAYISSNDGSSATAPVAGPFGSLHGITVNNSGSLWVLDERGMYEFDQGVTFTTDWSLHGIGTEPYGVDADSAGNLYAVDLNSGGAVVQLTSSGVLVGSVSRETFGATGFALDRADNDVYVDNGGGLISHFDSSCDVGGRCLAEDTFGSGQLSGAAGLAVDPSSSTVYAADTGDGRIDVFVPPPAIPPAIDSTTVRAASTSAELRAQINPNFYDTHFHFEYVDDATFQVSGFANASSTPVPDGDLGSADSDQIATAYPQSLEPSTTYHYRVVADNGNGGPQAGPALTFTTQPPATSFALPDDRAYEQVTPVAKGDGSLLPAGEGLYAFGGGYQASASGDKLAFITVTSLPGAQAGGANPVLATRGSSGWSAQSIVPPQAATTGLLQSPKVAGYSPDLSKVAFEDGGGEAYEGQDDPPLVSGEPPNNKNLFLRDNISASYQLMNITPQGDTPAPAGFSGASADYSHVVFSSETQLTPDALNGTANVYQWQDGTVSLVSQIPVAPATRCGGGGPACVAAPQGANAGAGNYPATDDGGQMNAVSHDGSKIFFKDGIGPDPNGQLYVRENGTTTVEISASQKTNGSGPGGTDPNGPLFPTYWPASADGSEAFFTSCEQLTNDSTAVFDGSSGCKSQGEFVGSDLYRYDTASGGLTDLTVDHHSDPLGADVQGVLGSSDDGSYVYFVANGVLAGGASLGDCSEDQFGDVTGQCNLYLSHDGTTTFIARLDNVGDRSDWNGESTARVTPNGTHVAFQSLRSLTGYDNTVASGSECGSQYGGGSLPPQCTEIFLYDASAGQLHCASCNPSGARPIGRASLPLAGERGATDTGAGFFGFEYVQRNLSEDGGRLFFDSEDALVPGDINGKRDVYEYENGRPYLISTGTSGDNSGFIDASASGSDVFFETGSQLVGQDTDQNNDIYDARVGGGFSSAQTPPPCFGEACKSPPSAQPEGQTPGSAGVSGAGNLASNSAPSPGAGTRSKPLTRAQKLALALKTCRHRPVRRRASCVAHARKLYGPKRAAANKTIKRFGKGGK